jgi:hypothetical protein
MLNKKISNRLVKYKKENKVKENILLNKQKDFQENYRAKMRAQERNLQALK